MNDHADPSATAARLNAEAMAAMGRRDLARAQDLLQNAVAQMPSFEAAWLNLAGVQRALKAPEAALHSANAAIKLNPRSFMGLLIKASLLEAAGDEVGAASTYGAAITVAPPFHTLSAATQRALEHGRGVNDRFADRLYDSVKAQIDAILGSVISEETTRINKFIDISLGRARRQNSEGETYFQNPSHFFYPDLQYTEFFDNKNFPWISNIEHNTDIVLEELQSVLSQHFPPYIQYDEGLPIDQWASLNHSERWGAFHLIANGEAHAENFQQCPRTCELIAQAPQPNIARNAPNAMFSRLRPKTRIPPHCGIANIRLVFHLPLIIPEGCGFRVGSQTRNWKVGQAWVFDDTIEHEAWNESDEDRYIFMMDVWHPNLSDLERHCISTIIAAISSASATDSKMSI